LSVGKKNLCHNHIFRIRICKKRFKMDTHFNEEKLLEIMHIQEQALYLDKILKMESILDFFWYSMKS